MTDVLGEVLASTRIDVCPRVLLGMECLVGTSYVCICRDVSTSVIEVAGDDESPEVRLSMELNQHVTEWAPVRRDIQLMGFSADYFIALGGLESGMKVVATFDVSRSDNAPLRKLLETSH